MEQIIGQNPQMNGSSPPSGGAMIVDTDTQNFAKDVIEASMQMPILVDFWAPWCEPCKQLTPILEKLVTAAGGAVRLVKVNMDENQMLARQLQVQSVPAVFAFFQGRPVDGFMGVQPESQIKQFIDALVKIGGGAAQIDEEAVLKQADAMLAEKQLGEAIALYQQVLEANPESARSYAGLVKCLIEGGQMDEALSMLAHAPDAVKDKPELAAIQTQLDMQERASELGDAAEFEGKLAKNENDHAARYDLAQIYFASGRREEAVDALLEIMRREAGWEDHKARTGLLEFFDVLGPSDPVTLAGRRKLSSLIFA